jgi:hypothetical protein
VGKLKCVLVLSVEEKFGVGIFPICVLGFVLSSFRPSNFLSLQPSGPRALVFFELTFF